MHFNLTEQQRLLKQAARDTLVGVCPASAVRALWSDPVGRSMERWRLLADAGLTGITISESFGGLGLSDLEQVLILEEAGRVALPEPLLESAVAAGLLNAVASEPVRREWLERLAAGGVVLAVGMGPLGPLVADAHLAQLLLLEHAGTLHAVPAGQATLVAQPSVDGGRRLSTVDWTPTPGTQIGEGDPARVALDAAFDRGALYAAAQMLGVGDRLIEMASTYAQQRQQFGRPIGSFQAVKHLLADALLRLSFARPVVYRAALSAAHEETSRARDVSMAKAYASEAAFQAARCALQVHGAIAYTQEHDAHFWMKRAWSLGTSWGTAAWHRARVADALLGERAGGSRATPTPVGDSC